MFKYNFDEMEKNIFLRKGAVIKGQSWVLRNSCRLVGVPRGALLPVLLVVGGCRWLRGWKGCRGSVKTGWRRGRWRRRCKNRQRGQTKRHGRLHMLNKGEKRDDEGVLLHHQIRSGLWQKRQEILREKANQWLIRWHGWLALNQKKKAKLQLFCPDPLPEWNVSDWTSAPQSLVSLVNRFRQCKLLCV